VGWFGTNHSRDSVFRASDCLLGRLELMNLWYVFLRSVKREAALPPVSPPKAALSEEELEKKSRAIIEEYLHLNDMKVSHESGLSEG